MKVFKCEYIQIQIPFRVTTFNSEYLQIEFKSEEIYMKVFISKVFFMRGYILTAFIQRPIQTDGTVYVLQTTSKGLWYAFEGSHKVPNSKIKGTLLHGV